MDQRRLGKSGIVVSALGLGTMTFGLQADEAESRRIMDQAVDAGVDFLDTAEVYPVPPSAETAGRTEEIVGRWLKERPRHSIILATKIAGAAHGWFNPPVRHGKAALDRVHLRAAIEGSLRRLQTDYVDLYQIHWPDHGMRHEDTLGVLDELKREGKVRAVGTSNDSAWGLMKSLQVSEARNLVRFDTIQNNFSFNNRRFEDDLAEICRREQVSLLPYSPLAGGVLSGKYLHGRLPAGARFTDYLAAGPRQQAMARRFVNDRSMESTRRFTAIAAEAGLDPVTMAIAWSLRHDFVASTLIGVSSAAQLAPNLAAAGVRLNPDVITALDTLSREILYPMG